MAYQSINPFNGELLQTFDQHTDAQMESALAKADSTFQYVWSKAAFRDRAKVVSRAASLMLERKERIFWSTTWESTNRSRSSKLVTTIGFAFSR